MPLGEDENTLTKKPMPPIALPTQAKPIGLPPVVQNDQNEVERLKTSGSGISQVQQKHPVLGGILRGLETVGNIALPGAMPNIPGTMAHHNVLLGQANRQLKQDVSNQENEAQASEAQARAEALANPQPKQPTNAFELWHQQNPQGTVEDWQNLQPDKEVKPTYQMTDEGLLAISPDGTAKAVMFNGNPVKAPTKEPTSDVATYTRDYLAANGLPDTPENRLKAHSAFTKETKTDPGVARAGAFLGGRVYEVADPDHPGQTIMVLGSQIQANHGTPFAGKGSASVTVPRKEREYMTSGKGGQQLTAFNTAIAHLDTLERLAGDLNNGNYQIVNRAAQEFAKQTGQPAPANFAAAMNAMSGEVASALKASGATDQEIAKVQETFSNVQSLPQATGAINTYRELLKSKRDNLRQQDVQAQQGRPNFGETQEPTRPANVPQGYIYNANGPKGAGWYKPMVH